MGKAIKHWFFVNLANLVTSIRLVCAVWLVILAVFSDKIGLMVFLVIVCGLTDALDGFLARHFHIESKAGAFLDRLADKIFICSTIFVLVWRYWPLINNKINSTIRYFTAGLVGVVILLELLLIISGIISFIKDLNVSSNKWGKRKMTVQFAVVFLWFFSFFLKNNLGIQIFQFSVFAIDFMLFVAIMLAIKSIEGYWQRWTK